MTDDRLWLDPRDAGVWRPERAAELRRARRGGWGAVLIAVAMVVAMVVVAAAEGLPIRDTDGIFGARFGILAGTLAAFFAIDLVPRAIARARRDGTGVGAPPPAPVGGRGDPPRRARRSSAARSGRQTPASRGSSHRRWSVTTPSVNDA